MRVLTSDEVHEAEQQAQARAGMSSLVLIQRAGQAVAQFCVAHFKFTTVCVVCGTGTNGARGLAAAESLRQIAENVSVILLASSTDTLEPDTAAFCSRLNQEPIWISDSTGFQSPHAQEALQADLIVDAFAQGKPPLGPLQRQAVAAVNDAFGTVVSVDLPAGVDPDRMLPFHQAEHDAVFAHGIIAFIAPRPAHVFAELTSGPIAVCEIGVQPALVSNKTEVQVITAQEVGIAFPSRSPDAHKGNLGHVLVIAGSAGKAGAAALAGMAALRTGAGLVTVACPESIQETVAGFAPEMMTQALPETETRSISSRAGEVIDKLMAGKDAVVLGPGLSLHPDTVAFVRALVQRCPAPLVLDADGINAFAGCAAELKTTAAVRFRVLTPHPGEAAGLLGTSSREVQADRSRSARRVAGETGACVVLKGWRSLVAGASGETWINMTGNAALAKAGSGDVLSGIIAAALARQPAPAGISQHLSPPEFQPPGTSMHEIQGADSAGKIRKHRTHQFQSNAALGAAFLSDVSVAAGVHLHGIAGDLARDALHENTVLARDVMDNLSQAFHELELQMDRGLFYLQK